MNRRVEVRLTDSAAESLERVAAANGYTQSQAIRAGIRLLELATEAKEDGGELAIVREGEPPRVLLIVSP